MRYYIYNKKNIVIMIVLLAVLFTVPFINTNNNLTNNNIESQFLAYENQDDSDRVIASAQNLLKKPQNSLNYVQNEQKFLKNLTEDDNVALSQLGKRPSKIEQFQFGVLSGNYSVMRSKGGISKLTVQSEVHTNELKKIEDKEEFLTDYRSFWFIPFQKVEKIIDVQVNDKNSEVFVLKNAENQSVGRATILSNQNGGMISLNFSELSYQ